MTLELLEENTLRSRVYVGGDASILETSFHIRFVEGAWHHIEDVAGNNWTGKARVAGRFQVAGDVKLSETGDRVFKASEQWQANDRVDVLFPKASRLMSTNSIRRKIEDDWNAASALGGDHNERGAWILLDTSSGSYLFDVWPTGDFFGVTPSPKPAEPAVSSPLAQPTYLVGEYHIHATLRHDQDVQTARQGGLPRGPSQEDHNGANAAGVPGLLWDRQGHEIIATGHTEPFDGPTRRALP